MTTGATIRAPGDSRGATVLSEAAVERIVVEAIASVPGTVSSSSRFSKLARRGFPRVDVQLDAFGGAVAAEAEIAVSWPSPVAHVARTVRSTVTRWLADATGLPVVRVDVKVASVTGRDGGAPMARVTRADLDAHDPAPPLAPPRVRPRHVTDPSPGPGGPEGLPVRSPTVGRGTAALISRPARPRAIPIEPTMRPVPRAGSRRIIHPRPSGPPLRVWSPSVRGNLGIRPPGKGGGGR